MTIQDHVPGGVPTTVISAMTAGLSAMGAPAVDVIVSADFVQTVQTLTGDTTYNDERNGGLVAARTVRTTSGSIVIIANWDTMHDLSPAEIERILAHEAGHVSIADRGEDTVDVAALFPDHYWNFQTAYAASVAIDEYRCEASVYKAGYPVEKGRLDPGIVDELYGLNIGLLAACNDYQEHLDVEDLRLDVLRAVSLNVRYMSCIAARHVHHDAIDPTQFNKYAEANWKALIKPTWNQFIAIYTPIPDALTPWSEPGPNQAITAAVPLISDLTKSFGYKARQDSFHITMTRQSIQVRLNRANAETAAHEHSI